jgi:hypothetical protein
LRGDMNSEAVAIKLALSIREAIEGVTYYPRGGAKCPWCGERLRVLDTKSWVGRSRIRYQKCVNNQCPLCVLDQSVKSIESE